MKFRHKLILAILTTPFISSCFLDAQEDFGWRISPVQINIRMHESRPLQLLDDSGKELHSGKWYVDNPDLAEIREEDGQVVLWPKSEGNVQVTAVLGGEIRRREIKIWPENAKLGGLVLWSTKPLGHEIADLPAVPTSDGPDLFSLEQDGKGTYIRAFTHDGFQRWLWTLPETTRKVEFVCSDDIGGVILSADNGDSYNLYVIAKDGKTRWHHTFAGIRKGHAVDYENLLHLLNQSADGMSATIVAWDEVTGVEKFSLKIPQSLENEINVQRTGHQIICTPGSSVGHELRTITSHLFVNTNGDAYAAFTRSEWKVGADKCASGIVLDQREAYFSWDDKLVLWQIHPDGTFKSTIVDSGKADHIPFPGPVNVISPTGDIIPDGFGGVLLSVRWTHTDISQKVDGASDEFVYRITDNDEVAYKFPLPKYSGQLHDEMVLGENDAGFAARGGVLVAFNVKDGSEMWHWDSGASEIKIHMATRGGGCVVDTPEGLVLVENGVKKRVVAPSGSSLFTPSTILHPAN